MATDHDRTLFEALSHAFREEYSEVTRTEFVRLSESRILLVVDNTAHGRPTVSLRQTGVSLEDCFERLRRRVSPTPGGT